MPTVEKVAGGRVTVRGIGEFVPGDTAEVSDADAQYLCEERGDFVRLDEQLDETPREEDGPPDGAFDFDPGGHSNFETNGWLDNDYQERAEAVRAGTMDDHLRAIEDAERSETVLDAVEQRRAELEG